MAENPKYLSLPVAQEPLLDNGLHVGYRVAVRLIKGEVEHEEAVDVVTGAEQAATLAEGEIGAFTLWVKAQIDANDLVAKANAALDAL